MIKYLAPIAWITIGAHARAQDAAAGKTVFSQCAACHSIDGSNGVGPSLKGIEGRQAGTFIGFRYSRAIKGAGYIWDAAKLNTFIANPQEALPGNVMPFSGLTDAQQRADLILYLQTVH